MKPSLLAMLTFASFIPPLAQSQIIMQSTEPDDMTGLPLQLGTSPSGISLSNTATVETTGTPASAPRMSIAEETAPQPVPFSPGFDATERYSLEPKPDRKNDAETKSEPPIKPPSETPTNISLNPNLATKEPQIPTAKSPTIDLAPEWQTNHSTIPATQPFTLAPEPPTPQETPASLSLHPETPTAPQD